MAQAYCDAGNYQQMLRYALQQTELANTQQDEFMKSEAFLNLAKAYERLADFGKAIGYGRASLQHPSVDPRTPGHAHLGPIHFLLYLKFLIKRKESTKNVEQMVAMNFTFYKLIFFYFFAAYHFIYHCGFNTATCAKCLTYQFLGNSRMIKITVKRKHFKKIYFKVKKKMQLL